MHEIVIVGAGPAGLSAALTARARGRQVLLLSNRYSASPLAKAAYIDNYPGVAAVSGLALLGAMTEQALAAGAELINERVISILPMGESFALSTGSEVYDAKAIILAVGTAKVPSLPGESEYLGRGVSYCATCDGMLFRGRRVLVYGLNEEAVGEANFLAGIGCDVVFVAPSVEAASGLVDTIEVQVGRLTAVVGDGLGVTGARYRLSSRGAGGGARGGAAAGTGGEPDVAGAGREPAAAVAGSEPAAAGAGCAAGAGSSTGAGRVEIETDCQAVFILRPAIAPDALVGGLALTDGNIAVGLDMSTSIPGVFAAGDCTGKPLQIAKAVGEGQIAGLSAEVFIS